MAAQVLDFKPNPLLRFLKDPHSDYWCIVTDCYKDGAMVVPKWKDLIPGEAYTVEDLYTTYDASLPEPENGRIPMILHYREERE